ncbi:MAG: RNA-protein complex protein Nop10 [Thermoplasmata archaeon]|nr:RNA-protein complex protein Nop10 [Thermoplasmata archaeon]
MSDGTLRVCRACHRYTLRERCPDCRAPSQNPHPARFSPEDRYGRYRRALLAAASAPSPPHE